MKEQNVADLACFKGKSTLFSHSNFYRYHRIITTYHFLYGRDKLAFSSRKKGGLSSIHMV